MSTHFNVCILQDLPFKMLKFVSKQFLYELLSCLPNFILQLYKCNTDIIRKPVISCLPRTAMNKASCALSIRVRDQLWRGSLGLSALLHL